ncbi:hypothetical protein CAEBREN_31031 [Caenorhabditis brenneri]|uniref:Uncharacterized protein n=1 Tax=Caenorhabditis brenneri TaxID=135651 RepID=G0MNJ4_CAEBE|nr:hypothetical protein CAEBREN_31031 [Caenorhabditis brenneri]
MNNLRKKSKSNEKNLHKLPETPSFVVEEGSNHTIEYT